MCPWLVHCITYQYQTVHIFAYIQGGDRMHMDELFKLTRTATNPCSASHTHRHTHTTLKN